MHPDSSSKTPGGLTAPLFFPADRVSVALVARYWKSICIPETFAMWFSIATKPFFKGTHPKRFTYMLTKKREKINYSPDPHFPSDLHTSNMPFSWSHTIDLTPPVRATSFSPVVPVLSLFLTLTRGSHEGGSRLKVQPNVSNWGRWSYWRRAVALSRFVKHLFRPFLLLLLLLSLSFLHHRLLEGVKVSERLSSKTQTPVCCHSFDCYPSITPPTPCPSFTSLWSCCLSVRGDLPRCLQPGEMCAHTVCMCVCLWGDL